MYFAFAAALCGAICFHFWRAVYSALRPYLSHLEDFCQKNLLWVSDLALGASSSHMTIDVSQNLTCTIFLEIADMDDRRDSSMGGVRRFR